MRSLVPAILALFALTIAPHASAQIGVWEDLMNSDQSPRGIRWKRINTPHFEIVFPAELQVEANRVANRLEQVRGPVSASLGTSPERITVLLPNQTTRTNGAVSMVPLRAYWYSTPPQGGELGSVEWYDMLALHETRHVAQMNAIDVGFTRVLSRAFGDVGLVPSAVLIPNWWWEGDAVGVETALSSGGRGRMPEFDMELRAHLLSGRALTYGQATRGSYRTWTPDHYLLGYFLTTRVKRTYGGKAWENVIQSTASRVYDPRAFSRALRKEIGRDAEDLYHETMRELRGLWEAQLRGVSLTEAAVRTRSSASWTSYRHPQWVGGDAFVAVRWGLRDRPALVRIDATGAETSLTPIAAMGGHISAAAGRVVWAERRPDPRWGERDVSVIRLYDLASRTTRTLTRSTKLFSPALSPDGRKVVAVEFTPKRRSALVVLDTGTGAELLRMQFAAGEFLALPRWSTGGDQIVFLRQADGQNAVSALRLSDGLIRDLIRGAGEHFGRVLLHGNHLLYNSAHSGIDNLYAIDLETSERFQVTSRRFGAFAPSVSPDGQRLLFNDYTADGYAAAEMPLDPGQWTPLKAVQDRSIRYYEPLIAQERAGDVLASVVDSLYEVSDYKPAAGLVNVHSHPWLVTPRGISAGVWSNNELNTLAVQAGYEYHRTERTNAVTLRGSYSGLYPILDFGLAAGKRSVMEEGEDEDEPHAVWNERSITAGVRLPLAFRNGTFKKWLSLGAHASVIHVTPDAQSKGMPPRSGRFASMTYEAQLGRSRSWMDGLWPDHGESVSLAYRHTLLGSDHKAAQLSAEGRVYRRGISAQHRLMLRAGVEKQRDGGYQFASATSTPRGYQRVNGQSMLTFSGDYSIPLVHPDLSVGPFFVRRVEGTLFYDHAISLGSTLPTYRSTGLELTADVVPFGLPFGLDLGVRSSYRVAEGRHSFEPIIRLRL